MGQGCLPLYETLWDARRTCAPPGRPPRLTARQRTRLLNLLLKGATAHGFSTDLWTLPRVAEIIARTFGVPYHPPHVWTLFARCGL